MTKKISNKVRVEHQPVIQFYLIMGSLVNKDFKATHIWVCLKSNEGAPEIQKGLVSSFDLSLKTDPICLL